jgi:ParB family chromosome partitioning protein
VSKFRGLPDDKRMRHDSHFVEEITSTRSESIGRLIDLDRIEPNPHQPRKNFGDLSEMVASIKEKGVLEPILVRALEGGKFEIIAGERRYQASKIAGLRHVPAIEVDVDNRGMLEISLIENLQRKDLTPFEEAAAIQRLCDQFRYTHEEIARKLGKSRTVITEALSLNRMPESVQERCRQADIESKSMLLQIVRQDTEDAMHQLVDRITGEGITREQARRFNRGDSGDERRPKRYVFRYAPEDEAFQFSLSFPRQDVQKSELVSALQAVLERLIREIHDEGRSATAAPVSSRKTRAPEPTV